MKNRISAAHLALVVRNRKTGAWRYFGLLNKGSWEKKMQRVLTPPGGAMLVLPAGEDLLVRDYGAEFTEEHETGGIDARFLVEDQHVDAVLTLIEGGNRQLFEMDVNRELVEELGTAEIPSLQTGPLLAPGALTSVTATLLGAFRQPPPVDGIGTSSKQGAEPSRRIFFCWGITVDDETWQVLERSALVELLTEEEVLTTNGGRGKGSSLNGSTIGDNIFSLPDAWKQSFLGAP